MADNGEQLTNYFWNGTHTIPQQGYGFHQKSHTIELSA